MAEFVVGAENLSAFVLVIMGLWLVVAAWRGKTPPSVILKGWREEVFVAGMKKPAVSWWRAALCWGWAFMVYMYIMDFYTWEVESLTSLLGTDSYDYGVQPESFEAWGYVVTVNVTVTPFAILATLLNAIVIVIALIALWSVVKNGFLGAWRIVRIFVFVQLSVLTLILSLVVWPVEWAWNNIKYRQQMRELKLENMIRDVANQAIRDAKTAGTICGGAHSSSGITEWRVQEIVQAVARVLVNREVTEAMNTMHDDRVRELVQDELDGYDPKVSGFVVTAIAALVRHGSLKVPDPSATQTMPVFRHRMPPTTGGAP